MSSRVVRGAGLRWPAVAVRAYQEESARTSCEVSRRVLAGREAGDDLQFEVRYFELLPGGATSYERHQHPHAVVVLAGRGQVRLGDERHEIEVSDVIYVAPGECHQFLAAADERLGILCVVDEERDRPEPVPETTE